MSDEIRRPASPETEAPGEVPAAPAPAETGPTALPADEPGTPATGDSMAEPAADEAATSSAADSAGPGGAPVPEPDQPDTAGASDANEPGEVMALKPSAPPTQPDEDSLRLAEALLFASAEPVTARGLQRLLPDNLDAEAVLVALRERYAGRGVELVEASGGVMFRTAPDIAPRLRKVIDSPRRLPRVAMETLAIIAYHQPMTRPEIEHIRGSALSQQTLDALLELNLIAPKGRRETPGRPTLWGTTPEFLAHFGLKDLRELPRREDLLLEPAPPRPETVTPDLQSPADAPPANDSAPAPPPAGEATQT